MYVNNSIKSQHKIQINLQTTVFSMVYILTHNIYLCLPSDLVLLVYLKILGILVGLADQQVLPTPPVLVVLGHLQSLINKGFIKSS